MRRVLRNLRPHALAPVVLALAVTGGVAYAAEKLGSKDIATGAIKSKHVKDGTLTGDDIAEDTLALPAGARGPQGPAGPPGLAALTSRQIDFEGEVHEVNDTVSKTVLCEPGERAVGGGGQGGGPFALLTSQPFPGAADTSPTGWTVIYVYRGSVPAQGSFEAWVVCAS